MIMAGLSSVSRAEGVTFTVKADVNLPKGALRQQVLLEVPDMLRLVIKDGRGKENVMQNYAAFPIPDGSVPVLEARLRILSPLSREERDPSMSFPSKGESEEVCMSIGLPLSLLPKPYGKHSVTLQFTDVEWSMYVDGVLYDNDFPFGYPALPSPTPSCLIDSSLVQRAECLVPAQEMRKDTHAHELKGEIQYWSPSYHNAWVGDVATCYHDGRYHIFYLFDRRGHSSKLGKGGHYFEHLSTSDFRHWTEHPAAVPIDHQWETLGTGTPFTWEGNLWLAYGMHTTRLYPREKTTLDGMWRQLETDGHTTPLPFPRRAKHCPPQNGVGLTSSQTYKYPFCPTDGTVPAGASYAVSHDGGNTFQKTNILFHPCENPSVFIDAEGKPRMYANYGARGTWCADSPQGEWRCVDENFPQGGDCTFSFQWGQYLYTIGGFRHLWMQHVGQGDTMLTDMVASGMDCYNGLSVPAVTALPDGRRVICGWVKTQNWGGLLAMHELLQMPDGRLRSRWLDEVVPATGKACKLKSEKSDHQDYLMPGTSFILSFDVSTSSPDALLTLLFSDAEGGEAQPSCAWQMDMQTDRAQYSTPSSATSGTIPSQRSLREGGDVSTARDYAIERVLEGRQTFHVRMLVKQSSKIQGCVIDTEIAGLNTMISYRHGLTPRHLRIIGNGTEIRNLQVAKLKAAQ